MSLDKGNKYEIRHRALLEAIRLCGGVAAYSRRLKVSRSRASNWCNRPEIVIPYEYVVLTEDITQVSIERLSPYTEAANKVIRRLRAKDNPSPINLALNEVHIGDLPYLTGSKQEHPIIVGTDGVLISGLLQMEIHKASGISKAPVMVLDLEALLLEKRSIEDMNLDLLISEQIAIGLRLEQLTGNRQGKRNDLDLCHPKGEIKNNGTLLPTWGEVKGRKDIKVAKILGYGTNTYYRAKQVYLQGGAELIDAMDRKEISIAVAAMQIKPTKKDVQQDNVQTKSKEAMS